jgi:CHASE3 domain sensor protein
MTSSTKSIAAFVLIILVCIATLSFWSEVRSEKDRDWIEHTHLAIERLQSIRIDIARAGKRSKKFCFDGTRRISESVRNEYR